MQKDSEVELGLLLFVIDDAVDEEEALLVEGVAMRLETSFLKEEDGRKKRK